MNTKKITSLVLFFMPLFVSAQLMNTGYGFLNKLGNSDHKAFIENDGQLNYLKGLENKKILFEFDDEKGMHAYFTSTGVIYNVSKDETVSEAEYENEMRESGKEVEKDKDKDRGSETRTITRTKFVEMNWENANQDVQVNGSDPTSFYFNYYMPNIDMNKVIGNVKGFTKIVYKNIYPGIDIEYTIHPDEGFKYSYVLHPGADPSMIRMNYSGADLKVDNSGNIIISTSCGDITDHAPLSYKEDGQNGNVIESRFVLLGKNTVSFKLADGHSVISETTIIDPWQVGPPFPINGYRPDDVAVDGSGNVLVYSYKPATILLNSVQRIDKYNSAGVFQWTFNLSTNASYINDYQGDVAADPAGNVYAAIGLGQTITTYYNTIKINPAGTALIWGTSTGSTSANNMFESWTITFNCNFSQFYQSGGGLVIAGTPMFNVGVEEPVNSATGAEGTMLENDTLGEIVCTYYAPNSLVYHMAADSNAGATRTGAATVGNFNTLTCINPSTGVRLFRVKTSYPYIDGDLKAPGSVGMNAMVSSCNYLYTMSGAKLDRWNPTTGQHFNQVTITGGSTASGTVNSGILTDKCGNVYVGANGNIYVYDPLLNLINTISGLPGRVFDMAWGDNTNTNLIVCGGTSNATTFLASVAVTSCTLPNMVTITPTQPTCSVSTGSATANATFCGAPYSFLWSDGQTTQTATGLAAGTYTVTVSSSVSCPYSYVQTQTVTINPPASTLTATQASSNITCNGGCNGTATVTPSGGTPGYTYSWSPSGGTAATATGLCVNNYICTVTDAGGCVTTQSFSITQPSVLSASSTTTAATCGGTNGTATATASGGTSGYSYSWTPSGGNAALASGLSAGSYTCTITDANNCTTTTIANVGSSGGPNSTIASSGNISCFGGANGTATANATGGTPGYTYNWTPSGGTAATASGLSQGSYTCTITDANGCTTTSVVSITEPAQLTTSSSSTPSGCTSNTGTATVIPSGGTSGYTYNWSPSGGTNATANSLAAGPYTCVVTDANGCTSTASVTVGGSNAPTATLAASADISCFGGSNGTATANPSGGTLPYSYAWTPTGGNAAVANGLASGSYTCTITDANGCTATVTVSLTQPSLLTASVTSTAATCTGNNGTATVTPGGGAGSYTYNWAPSGGTGSTATGLAAGNYTVTVTDANSCTTTQTINITQTSGLTSTVAPTNVTCFGSANGSATANPTSGTAPYTYSWSSGGTAATETGLPPGTYTCTITDSNGCVGTQTVTLTQPTQLTSSVTSGNITCNGAANGTGTVTGNGGTPNYSYNWAPSGGNASTANGLGQGSYTCTVTDANGCITTQSITITQPSLLSATSSGTNILCNGQSTGTATVNASGGTAGYSYNWTPSGGTSASASGLGAATYTCTITDANGCVTTQTVTVTQPAALSVAVNGDNVCGGAQAQLTSNGIGGVGPYAYLWSNGSTNASQSVSVASTTTFTVTVTDANGCATTGTATATVSPAPSASFTSNATNGFFNLANNGTQLCFTAADTNAIWNWQFSGGGSSNQQAPCITISSSDTGQFCAELFVQNLSGCSDSSEQCITIGESFFSIPNIFTPNGDGSNDVFLITNSGMKSVQCTIYDRWGELIYSWDGTSGGWDGKTKNGNEAVDGVYYYTAMIVDYAEKQYAEKGFVELIRGRR